MAPRFDVSSIRREQILHAARELFAARGVAAVRLEEIASRIDVSKAALYLYYPGKDAIVAAVVDLHAAQLRSELDEILGGAGNALDRLLAAVAAMQSPTLPVRLRSEIMGLACSSEVVAEAMRARHRNTVEQLTGFFAELAKAGQLVDVEPAVAARRILYLSEGILLVRATVDDPATVAAESHAILVSFAASCFPDALEQVACT